MNVKEFLDADWTLMPYPCSQFYAGVNYDIRFDNRFEIKLP